VTRIGVCAVTTAVRKGIRSRCITERPSPRTDKQPTRSNCLPPCAVAVIAARTAAAVTTQVIVDDVPIRATLMLADSAQAADGKLYILGGGWNLIGPDPSPMAIALYLDVSWDLTNVRHQWRLDLVDSDGEPVMIPTPLGDQALVLQGEFEVGRPVGVTPGTGLGVPLAINLGPLPLSPGRRYEWRLTIGQQSDENWRLPFSTRVGPASTSAPPTEE
jgi:hypothetical protein